MKTNKPNPKTIILGISIGILSGYLGIGGGILLVPALTHFYNYTRHTATKISTAIIAPTAISATISYWNQQQPPQLNTSLLLAATTLTGAQIGHKILPKLSTKTLQISAITLYLIILTQLLTQPLLNPTTLNHHTPTTTTLIITIGILTGIATTTLGIGGGIILVPTLNFTLELPPPTAKATTLLAIIPATTITTLQNIYKKQLPPKIIPTLIISAISTSWIGTKLATNTPNNINTTIFATLILTILTKTIIDIKKPKK